MSAETPENTVSYKELEDIEKQFEDVEIEISKLDCSLHNFTILTVFQSANKRK